jgi:hypothetical protein
LTDPGTDPNLLIDRLVTDLRPVRVLTSPWIRAGWWLAGVLALAALFASFADLSGLERRLASEPDMWLAVLGSTATAVLAAVAAFQLSLPDRSRRWALLPLPALALWAGASGLGCARTWLLPRPEGVVSDEMRHCLMFIIALAVPLSAAMFLMLRRGYSLYPSLTGAVAGLAIAAAAATLLNFFHPFDAAFDDLMVHALAVAIVVLLNRFVGRSVLDRAPRTS